MILQFGVPPNRIDLINRIDGVEFSDAWGNRLELAVKTREGNIAVWMIGIEDLIRNKRSAARPKDLDDLRFVEQHDDSGD